MVSGKPSSSERGIMAIDMATLSKEEMKVTPQQRARIVIGKASSGTDSWATGFWQLHECIGTGKWGRDLILAFGTCLVLGISSSIPIVEVSNVFIDDVLVEHTFGRVGVRNALLWVKKMQSKAEKIFCCLARGLCWCIGMKWEQFIPDLVLIEAVGWSIVWCQGCEIARFCFVSFSVESFVDTEDSWLRRLSSSLEFEEFRMLLIEMPSMCQANELPYAVHWLPEVYEDQLLLPSNSNQWVQDYSTDSEYCLVPLYMESINGMTRSNVQEF